MTSEELVDEFVVLCHAIFADDIGANERTQRLETGIQQMLGSEGRRMISHESLCYIFVCAVPEVSVSLPPMLVLTALSGKLRVPPGYPRSLQANPNCELRWNNPSHVLAVEVANKGKSRKRRIEGCREDLRRRNPLKLTHSNTQTKPNYTLPSSNSAIRRYTIDSRGLDIPGESRYGCTPYRTPPSSAHHSGEVDFRPSTESSDERSPS
ncbi:hypothetical protein DL96DRAFT_1564782 [Flagelloscypha sp. PMI_526]|nr:hypothetical protein DL96DRAFT_1564782 [Flagelloscypha sp. PMI_526]